MTVCDPDGMSFGYDVCDGDGCGVRSNRFPFPHARGCKYGSDGQVAEADEPITGDAPPVDEYRLSSRPGVVGGPS